MGPALLNRTGPIKSGCVNDCWHSLRNISGAYERALLKDNTVTYTKESNETTFAYCEQLCVCSLILARALNELAFLSRANGISLT